MPPVSFLDTRRELPRSLSRPLAKGGEGVAVARGHRLFSRFDRPFGLRTRFWSLGFLRRSCQSAREFGVEIFERRLRNGVRDLGGSPLFSPRGRLGSAEAEPSLSHSVIVTLSPYRQTSSLQRTSSEPKLSLGRKGGEGAAVAQRCRPFSRLSRSFAFEMNFWSLGSIQSSCLLRGVLERL